MYSVQQIRIFKVVPKQETMEYVINNLSNRFELASAPNLFSIFERYSETNTESMQYDIKRPSDLMMYEYTNKMNNRIKMFLKKLFLEWRRVYESGKSSGVQELSAVNDEGKQFDLIADNVSSIIEVNSIKILNNFVQDKNINDWRYEILDMASAISSGRKYSKEQYEHVIDIYGRYEDLLKSLGRTNGQVDVSMEVIMESYKDKLKNGF